MSSYDENLAEHLREFVEDLCRHDAELHAKYGSRIHELRDCARRQAEVIRILTEERLGLTQLRAARVLEMLATKGAKARLIGSLRNGGFTLQSDADFLIESCPEMVKRSIEAYVADIMEEIPFDLLYIEELNTHWRSKLRYKD